MTDHVAPQDKAGLDLSAYHHRHSVDTRASDAVGSHGHIPNARIAEYADDARLDLHRIILGDGRHAGFKLVDARFQYFAELTWPGAVTIGVGITGIGRTSLREIAGFFRDGRCHVLAQFVLVKAPDGVAAPLTDAERGRAAQFAVAASPA